MTARQLPPDLQPAGSRGRLKVAPGGWRVTRGPNVHFHLHSECLSRALRREEGDRKKKIIVLGVVGGAGGS